jgi:gamma-glutamyltranspeptidase/glutathione hydrolase
MAPTILLKSGKPRLVVGGSGGPRIITSVVQVVLHVMDDRPLEEAMSAVRLHHQWQPDEIFFDQEPPPDLVENLTARGHKISAKRKGAAVQAILILDDGTLVGASAPGKGGRPAGVE